MIKIFTQIVKSDDDSVMYEVYHNLIRISQLYIDIS